MFMLALAGLLLGWAASAADLTPAQNEFFERHIRPVLAAECYECHSTAKKKGGLALDTRNGLLKGGESGPALAPGEPEASLLLRVLRHSHPKLRMPKNGAKLDARNIANFAEWIRQGAPDPRTGSATAPHSEAPASWKDTLAFRRQWWSFQPLSKPTVPAPKNAAWSANAIDRFLLNAMEQRGLAPGPAADPRTIFRRLTFALTGLPPKSEEVEAFVKEWELPTARRQLIIERLTDRLLASPAFAERWARHWLDLVRYAETHGSEGDPEIPQAWRYRDYVIRAFAADVPADQLIREHIAGDLLSPAQTRWNKTDALNESRLGLAHFRLVEHGFQPVDTLDDQVKAVDSQIDVLAKAFQGLTISCARCHDHKFDPISQRDYTALFGVLASVRPAQVQLDAPEVLNKNRADLIALKAQIKSALADSWRDAIPPLIVQLTRGSSADPLLGSLHQRLAAAEQELAALEATARTKALASRAGGLQSPPIAPSSPERRLEITAPPQPISRWSFDTDARDQLGNRHGELLSGATLRNGRLVLDGKEAHLRSALLGRELREKTLEAWVTLANFDQAGGGVVTVETSNGAVFDAIVFAEKEPRKWVNGSDFFRRSRNLDGPAESAKPDELIHVAVSYRADGSVAFFRNGQPYAAPHKPESPLVVFPTDAHVLLGRRHTGGGRAHFAGEIDEARLYDRALSPAEIAASFRTGPVGVSAADIAKAMTPEQTARHAQLTASAKQLRAELAAKSPTSSEAIAAALKDAANNPDNPLHAWAKLGQLDDAAFARGWVELEQAWRARLSSVREHNAKFTPAWDLAKPDEAAQWFAEGSAFLGSATARIIPGDFALEPEGERVLKGLLPAGISSHLISEKHGGLLTSPRFRITTDNLSVRAAGGKGATVRLIVDNYPLGVNAVFPKAALNRDDAGWLRLDTAYRKDSWAYLEFGTADDLTRRFGNSDAEGRSWFFADRVVSHDAPAPPRDEPQALVALLARADGSKAPVNAATLARHYAATLAAAVQAWRDGSLDEPHRALLDACLRRGLLPTSVKALPTVAPLIAEYRRREAEISAPRRAPGVIEGTAFDAPMFPRGDHTRPGEPVRRGYLEVLHLGGEASSVKPSLTAGASGRLELANAIASPRNPLTARVMVNRVWHHLFGRGLVATVDNFGRLGDQPTHPELLDHLASQFIADGWSFKTLIRRLVTTHAYQLASEPTAAARERDASNEVLSHFRVRRLEAEAIRDTLLTVSGRLEPTQFGPPVGIGDRTRRSIYLNVRRNNLSPFLEIFDAPKPFTTLGRRDTTNVPAQSLAFLNDPFVIEAAKNWAELLLRQSPGAGVDARLRQLYRAAFARPPSADELAKSRAYLATLGTDAEDPRVWQDFIQSLFNLKEFIYVR